MDTLTLDDLSGLPGLLTEEEALIRATARAFVAEQVLPQIADHFERKTFPDELVPELGALGYLGANLTGYGCAGVNMVSYGLMLQEIEYGDSGLRSFVSVQGSLAMYAIHRFGSEEQKQAHLPPMARGQQIGCFGLTEPDHGSDPGGMRTFARTRGNTFVLNGTKAWITNSPVADVAVVWAKLDEDSHKAVRGFIVERGSKGFETPPMKSKMSMRASHTGEIVLSDCVVPKESMLPLSNGLGSPLACLNQARMGIAWGAIGAAKACFESALAYARTRTQFGKPIGSKQLIQDQLVEMALEITKADLMNLHISRLKDAGKVTPQQVSMCKKNSVAQALRIARMARAIHGANGISLEYCPVRHMLNLESVYTYEGTNEVHSLIIGQGLTGFSAF
ncbi:MAG: acyl-CoA dehydrogenase family protein [Candidatus Lambdaproteobacteria bacterium]|nr:acyl-CoA dehydrogenase family protein [Candidatus Lambdaproteobacteria bacterium]